jgi:hypothetical protein
MTSDRRAALVEKARTYLGLDMPTPNIAAAIDLIRADVLEEAARVADATTAFDDNLQQSAGCWTTGQRIAAAIRALKGNT